MSASPYKFEYIFLYAFSALSVVGVLFLSDKAWFLPLFLLLWGMIGLFRITILTTPFDGVFGSQLPQKILRTLGLFYQNRKDIILTAVFQNPVMIMAIFLVILCLSVIALNPDLPNLDFAFVTGVNENMNDVIAQSYHFFVMDALFLPLLIVVAFTVILTYCTEQKLAHIAAGIIALLFIVIGGIGIMGSDFATNHGAFYQRAQLGGFALAALPYILAAYFIFMPFVIAERIQPLRLLHLIFIGTAMAVFDLFIPSSDMHAAFMMLGWFQIAIVIGPMLYEWQKSWCNYLSLRKNLDFRTKVEHS